MLEFVSFSLSKTTIYKIAYGICANSVHNFEHNSIKFTTSTQGKTEVTTREGAAEHRYALDEGLVEFGTAVNDCGFGRAVVYLESLDDRPAAKAMWHNLASVSLQQQNLWVAQRSYAALGNASKAFYLSETIRIGAEYAVVHGQGARCPEVEARLALLRGDVRAAERIYLEQGQLEAALDMYKRLRHWDEAIRLAERRGYARLDALRDEQMAYLLGNGQEEQAGQVLEDRGEPDQAMTLYMKAGKTARAARLALKMPHLQQNEQLMHRVTSALVKSGRAMGRAMRNTRSQFGVCTNGGNFVGPFPHSIDGKTYFRGTRTRTFLASELFELAGDLSNRLQQPEEAIAMYQRGGAFARAIELARNVQPELVTVLEEEWGDWYVCVCVRACCVGACITFGFNVCSRITHDAILHYTFYYVRCTYFTMYRVVSKQYAV